MDNIVDKKSDRFLLIDVMGEEFKVVKKVAIQIPFFEALVETQPSERIIIDEVSPEFLKILIDFIKNSNDINYFKKHIRDFENKSLRYWLKYLGMNDLYKTLYGTDFFNDEKRLLIDDVIQISSICNKTIWYAFKLLNGKYIMFMGEPDLNLNDPNMRVHVLLKKIMTSGKYVIMSKDNQREIILDPSLVVSDSGNTICVSLKTAVNHRILSYSNEIENIFC